MDSQNYSQRLGLSVKHKAFFYTHDEQQVHIDFNLKYEYRRYIQDPETAVERFVGLSRPTTYRRFSASVGVGESLSLEEISNGVDKALKDVYGEGRDDLIRFACEEVRKIYPTKPTCSTLIDSRRGMGMLPSCKFLYLRIEAWLIMREYEETEAETETKRRQDRPCCSICLEELRGECLEQVQVQVQLEVCSHVFHYDCIMDWLETNRIRSCPLCRKLVPSSTQPFTYFYDV